MWRDTKDHAILDKQAITQLTEGEKQAVDPQSDSKSWLLIQGNPDSMISKIILVKTRTIELASTGRYNHFRDFRMDYPKQRITMNVLRTDFFWGSYRAGFRLFFFEFFLLNFELAGPKQLKTRFTRIKLNNQSLEQ